LSAPYTEKSWNYPGKKKRKGTRGKNRHPYSCVGRYRGRTIITAVAYPREGDPRENGNGGRENLPACLTLPVISWREAKLKSLSTTKKNKVKWGGGGGGGQKKKKGKEEK